MASLIGELFFPAYDPGTAIILSLGVFALGFIARPMGAMVLGYIGDKWGGLISLRISLFSMAIATLSIGLLPTYQTLGIWAPIILTVLRMIQGMSMGAEFSTSIMTPINQTSRQRSWMNLK
jgi:MHS family proline/betaine transporter-like MFS transporter